MGYENHFTGAITITPPLTRSQIGDPRIARITDVSLHIAEQKTESDDGESFTVRPVADAIVPLSMEYSGHNLEDDIQLIVDTFSEHEFAGFIEVRWDGGFGEPPSRFIVKDDRVMRIDAQYRWPGAWDDGPTAEQDAGVQAVATVLDRIAADRKSGILKLSNATERSLSELAAVFVDRVLELEARDAKAGA